MSTVNDSLYVKGTLRADAMVIPSNAIGDSQVNPASPIAAEKLEHQYNKQVEQKHTETAVAERRIIHVAYAAGTLEQFQAGCTVANIGDSTVTVDLLKNGSSILSAVPTIDSGDAAFALVLGTISSAAYVAGDVFEVSITVSAGTGTLGKGTFGNALFREQAGA